MLVEGRDAGFFIMKINEVLDVSICSVPLAAAQPPWCFGKITHSLSAEMPMTDTVSELAKRGRELSPDDRNRLVDLLLESLAVTPLTDVEAAWEVEIERRLAAYDRGEMQAIDAEEVFAKARQIAA